MDDLVAGADGLARCGWAGASQVYVDYHDTEWGRPVHGDQALFERVSLEAFQSGLAWITILRKRPAFREAFCGFEPRAVAAFGPGDVDRLMQDAGIVRNRRKIEATIANARSVVRLQQDGGEGSLDALVWGFAEPGRPRPVAQLEIPAATTRSAELARALKSAGFVFVGPTTAYAAMQACGLVNDHLVGCHVEY